MMDERKLKAEMARLEIKREIIDTKADIKRCAVQSQCSDEDENESVERSTT